MIKFYTTGSLTPQQLLSSFIIPKLNSDFGVECSYVNSTTINITNFNGKSFQGPIGTTTNMESNPVIWNVVIGNEVDNEFIIAYPQSDTSVKNPGRLLMLFVNANNNLSGRLDDNSSIYSSYNTAYNDSNTSTNAIDHITRAFYYGNITNLYISPTGRWNNPGIKYKSGRDVFYTLGMCFYCKSLEESA